MQNQVDMQVSWKGLPPRTPLHVFGTLPKTNLEHAQRTMVIQEPVPVHLLCLYFEGTLSEVLKSDTKRKRNHLRGPLILRRACDMLTDKVRCRQRRIVGGDLDPECHS